MIRLILVFTLAASAFCDVLADAAWNAAVSGDWRTDSNWAGSVAPSSEGRTYITADDNGYTVTLGPGTGVKTKGITVKGKTSSSYNTLLDISGTGLVSDGAGVSVSYGMVKVGPGAELEVKNSSGSTVGLGGKIEIDGGTFVMTNGVTGKIGIGHNQWLPGGNPAFSIRSGRAFFRGSETVLSFENYSLFSMTGGEMEIIDTSADRNAMILYTEGNSAATTFFSMSGDSVLRLPKGGTLNFGHGVSEFKDNARLSISSDNARNCLFFAPPFSSWNRKTTVNVSGNAEISAVNLNCVELGKSDLRVPGTSGELNVSGGRMELGLKTTLGAGIGRYKVNMSGGAIDFTGYGVRIGTPPYTPLYQTAAGAYVLANTTTVTVAGGTFSCSGEQSHYNTPRRQMWGFIVGAGLVGRTNVKLTSGWLDGRVNLQDGTVTNGCTLKMFGVGRGIGTMTQTGGRYVGDSAAYGGYGRNPDALVLGAFGGEGVYDMRGGESELRCPLFVGGVSLGKINRTDDDGMLPADTAGRAVGALKVSGGAMTVRYSSYVGYDGKGTIEVSGDGSLVFSDDLTLTNSVAGAATLKVALVGAAAPSFKIQGGLTVCADARLEVDADDFSGSDSWIKVIYVAGGRTGDFEPENIVLSGRGIIVQNRRGDNSGSIWLHREKGLRITVR